MTAPITPDERAILRETVTLLRRILSPTRVERVYITQMPRLLDALDTAEREATLLREDVAEVRAALAEAQTKIVRQRDRLASSRAKVKRQAAEVTRILAERTAAHADDATCASCTHEYVADMEKRVEEAEAEVERLRAAPVWDEDTVTEAVAREMFPHFFTDDRQPLRVFTETRSDAELWEAERESARRKARQALAVVREHLPVRPDREDVARALWRQTVRDNAMHDESVVPWDEIPTETREWWCVYADAVLALWPGESRATVQAEALRDAADAAVAQDNTQGDWWDDDQQTYGTPVDWLRARADRLDPKEK